MYDILLMTLGVLLGVLLYLRVPRLKPVGSLPRAKVSVVIPARDEARHIQDIILSLLQQSLPPHEIIVVDDDSSDETAALAAQAGAKVIPAGEKPEGWLGKTWACQQGAHSAGGELILFLDADVRVHRNGLAKLVDLYRQTGDGVVSVQPYHTVKKLYEHFAVFFNIIAVAATGIGLPFMRRPAGLFGPVVLISKDLYMQHGGHTTVKSKVLEDFLLGKYYAKQNIPIALAIGKKDVCYRMYPAGFRDLWFGFTKNFFSGAANSSFPLVLPAIVWVVALTGSFINLVQSLCAPDGMLWIHAMFYGVFVLQVLYVSKTVGNFSWLASLFYPVFLAGFHVIFIVSLIKHLFIKQVTWKGRKISTQGAFHADR